MWYQGKRQFMTASEYYKNKQYDLCIETLEEDLKHSKNKSVTYSNLGTASKASGNIKQAITYYEHSLKLNENPEILLNLAAANSLISEYHESYKYLSRIEKVYRDHSSKKTFIYALGECLYNLRMYKRAMDEYHKINDQHNIARCLLALGLESKKPTKYYVQAISILESLPVSEAVLADLGCTNLLIGDYKRAEEYNSTLLELYQDNEICRINLAYALLARSKWSQGWKYYEHRKEIKGITPWPREANNTINTNTGSIAIRLEQGRGDFIQMIRFIKSLSSHEIILESRADMIELCQYNNIAHKYAIYGEAIEADNHIMLCSLPLITKCPVLPESYIKAPIADFKLPKNSIGIAWQGNTEYVHDHQRSIPLSWFKELSQIGNLTSLQRGTGIEQISAVDFQVNVLPVELDWIRTAQAINLCDYVVCSDSAIAHLAGAMGKKCFVIVHNPIDWRWNNNWYNNLTVIKNPSNIGKVINVIRSKAV